MNTVTMAGTVRGTIILAKIPGAFNPSMTAASSISLGNDRINAANIIIVNGIAFAI
ncbi:hypothetical protein D3C71_1441930 [compost metagenome]